MKAFFSYFLILFSLIFGVVLYDQFSLANFTYIDEIIALVLFCECARRRKIGPEFRKFILLSLFFLGYSVLKPNNVLSAIITDYIIIIKPFIAFYSVYYMGLNLNEGQKAGVKRIVILIAFFFLFGSIINYELFVWTIPSHASRFATMMSVLAFSYYYCSKREKSSLITTLLILAISLLSFRSKAYGFFAIALVFSLFFNSEKFKLNIFSIMGIAASLMLVVFVSWEKVSFYFMEGTQSDYIEDYMARPALYAGSVKVLQDYPLMGSGLGTYASFASDKYYSPIYSKYDLDKVHGLNEGGAFISDTFFPCLAQYGLIGISFFFYFFYHRYTEVRENKKKTGNVMWFKMSLLFLIFFLIESTSDSTLVQNRGVVMMMLFAMYIKDNKESKKIL